MFYTSLPLCLPPFLPPCYFSLVGADESGVRGRKRRDLVGRCMEVIRMHTSIVVALHSVDGLS